MNQTCSLSLLIPTFFKNYFELITDPKQADAHNTIFVFENGFKKRYSLKDPDLYHGIRAVGGQEIDFLTKLF